MLVKAPYLYVQAYYVRINLSILRVCFHVYSHVQADKSIDQERVDSRDNEPARQPCETGGSDAPVSKRILLGSSSLFFPNRELSQMNHYTVNQEQVHMATIKSLSSSQRYTSLVLRLLGEERKVCLIKV